MDFTNILGVAHLLSLRVVWTILRFYFHYIENHFFCIKKIHPWFTLLLLPHPPVGWCCGDRASSGTWGSLSRMTSMMRWSLTSPLEAMVTATTGMLKQIHSSKKPSPATLLTRLQSRFYWSELQWTVAVCDFVCLQIFVQSGGDEAVPEDHAPGTEQDARRWDQGRRRQGCPTKEVWDEGELSQMDSGQQDGVCVCCLYPVQVLFFFCPTLTEYSSVFSVADVHGVSDSSLQTVHWRLPGPTRCYLHSRGGTQGLNNWVSHFNSKCGPAYSLQTGLRS